MRVGESDALGEHLSIVIIGVGLIGESVAIAQSLGDGVLAVFAGPARAIACAQALSSGVAELSLSLRAGVHTGECEVVVDKLRGIAVHIGARVAATAGAGEILASQTVRDLVAGSGIEFVDHGTHQLKGVPGDWRLYSIA